MYTVGKRRLREMGIGFLYCYAAALVFLLLFRGDKPILPVDLVGILIISAFFTLGMGFIFSAVIVRTRGFILALAAAIRGAALGLILLACLVGGAWLDAMVFHSFSGAWAHLTNIVTDPVLRVGFLYGTGAVFLYALVNGVSQKLGPGVLTSWLVGRYHQPREVQRIFMFLDLRNSTGLAEKLGDLKYSALIKDFFADITTPLLDSRGEISHFIGDEVVLCWKVSRGVENANCLRCFFDIRQVIARNSQRYRERYGVVPEFKAGTHWGTVVATDVGEVKSEIVYHGDVLNVASRLQAMCKEVGSDLVISLDLAAILPQVEFLRIEPLGTHTLKGRSKAIEVATCVAV